MRVAITQPNFLPWLGYFDLLASVDMFVVLDDVQLTRRSYIVRNRIVSHLGKKEWLSLNAAKSPREAAMNDVPISERNPWWEKMMHRLELAYGEHPFWKSFAPQLFQMLAPVRGESVATYNWRMIGELYDMMGFEPLKWRLASTLDCPTQTNSPERRILEICRQFGADSFYNFKNGIERGLYSPELFKNHGISLHKQIYRHPMYRQSYGASGKTEFIPNLSIIDLIFCVGPEEAGRVVRSGSHWEKTN